MTGFAAFDEFLALPRVTALALSPDGRRLVGTLGRLNDKGDEFVDALWEFDPAGTAPARQLTRSDKGEKAPAFHPDGSVLFVSQRGAEEDDDPAALWQLPPAGEARSMLARPGGVSGAAVARDSGRVVVVSSALPGAADAEADEQRRTARKKAKVKATLHTASPVRFWDHDLGPAQTRLYALDLDSPGEPLDLTPAPGRALDELSYAITPDGSTVVTTWELLDEPGFPRARLVAIDTASGEQRVLADDPDASFAEPAISRDGRWLVAVREQRTTYDEPPAVSLRLVELATGTARDLVTDPDVWPAAPRFAADSRRIFFTADERGHGPIFRLDPESGGVSRVTSHGHYVSVQVAPDGERLFALYSDVGTPPRPVRLDATAVDGEPTFLPWPGPSEPIGVPERVSATAADGTVVEGWLSRPDGASAESPAPLLLWAHGGPLGSWNSWSWRWNSWLMTGQGYAVLQPDPALSTGYGASMIRRGWGEWGGAPFTDLMAITDVVAARPDIDETRTAAMGGSYGGYMANWIAGHTDRFRCIVTHASLWALDQFQGTTDVPGYWIREWGLFPERPERYEQWSPHHSLKSINTPMLVIHGDKDYRVPVGEALRLWWDLQREGVESAYLYFPDEGHWVLKPGNARVWYETCWAWLARHLHGTEWVQPDLL